jgi:hypothetical protein
MLINRRSLLAGLASFMGGVPAIVRASNLIPIMVG